LLTLGKIIAYRYHKVSSPDFTTQAWWIFAQMDSQAK